MSRPPPPRGFDLGPFRLEVTERRLLRAGESVPLRGKAFDLLVLLAERAGRLVPHEEILDGVWPDVVVEPGNIAHNVAIVRKALAGAPGPSIETVPRRGYRLMGPVRVHAAEEPPAPAASPPTEGAVEPQRIAFCRAADGVRLAYARHGAGPTVVKVANWLSHLEIDFASEVWRHWLALLARGREVLRYDARGNGLSEWSVPAIRFEHFVGDLDIRERLAEVRAPTLVLHARADAVVPLSDGMELASGIPGARFRSLESPNHLLLADEPSWAPASAEIDAFLAEHGAPS